MKERKLTAAKMNPFVALSKATFDSYVTIEIDDLGYESLFPTRQMMLVTKIKIETIDNKDLQGSWKHTEYFADMIWNLYWGGMKSLIGHVKNLIDQPRIAFLVRHVDT